MTALANVATNNTLETTHSKTPEFQYIPALDGLRGVAILLVITGHYYYNYSICTLGWAGVDLFFVLSGFLITKRLMENKERKDRYSIFYRNRALRILPLYYLTLVLFYFFVYFLVSPKNFHRFDFYVSNKTAFFLFFQNWLFKLNLPLEEHHLVHFWSLAIEEQFYLFWPWFLYTFYNNKYFKNILLSIIVGVFLLRNGLYFFNGKLNLYTNTFCRMDSLVMGALTWFLVQKPLSAKRVMWIEIITLAVLIAGYTHIENMHHKSLFSTTIGYTAFAFLFASIIYKIVIHPGAMIARILKNAFLRFTGKISYGLYIIHLPVIIIVQPKISPILRTHHLTMAIIPICILLTYALSIGSYYFYERYFLKRKKGITA